MDGKFTLICPSCHARLGHIDRKSKIDKTLKCKRCDRMIVYHVDTCEAEVKPLPKRTCASGMTFI